MKIFLLWLNFTYHIKKKSSSMLLFVIFLHCLSPYQNIVLNLLLGSCTQPSFFPFKCFHPNFRDKGLQFPASHVVNLPETYFSFTQNFPLSLHFPLFPPTGLRVIRKCYEAAVICEDVGMRKMSGNIGLLWEMKTGVRRAGSPAWRTGRRNHSKLSHILTQNKTNTSTCLHDSGSVGFVPGARG